jgi:hypothetical protein
LAHTHPGSALSPLTLGTEDLDGIITPGFYIQGSDASTSTASHYPELQAGSLRVEEGAGPKQTYHVYNSTRVWTRAKYQAEAWTPWAREYNTQNKPTPADIGAAPASHTHTPASIGAAPASHTHTPASIGAAYTMRPFTNGGNITGFTQCTVSLVRGGRIYPLTFAIPSATTSFWIVNRGGENADKDYDFGVTCTRSGSNMALTVVGSGPTLSTIYVM